MTSFQYIARTADGQQVTGVMEADTEATVAGTLGERRLYCVAIEEKAVPRGCSLGRVKLREVGRMYGQLADLLAAGVPLLRAMETLSRVGVSRRLNGHLVRLRQDVAAGATLADALGRAEHEKVFSSLHCAIVRAGERAGFLEEALADLAAFIERQDELRSKVRGALIYPALLAGLGTVAVTGILVVLVPRFKPLMGNIELPLPTRVLFGLSDLLVYNLPLAALGAAGAVALLRALLRCGACRSAWERWRVRLPLLGRAMAMVSLARFCRVLGTMLTNGVPILQALAISKDATGSSTMARGIEQAAESVRAGDSLAQPLRRTGGVPAEIVEMIAVGEESNQLPKVLLQVADTVERRTNRQVDVAVRLMEPLILVVLAVAIGLVAVGLLYPMFVMSQALQ